MSGTGARMPIINLTLATFWVEGNLGFTGQTRLLSVVLQSGQRDCTEDMRTPSKLKGLHFGSLKSTHSSIHVYIYIHVHIHYVHPLSHPSRVGASPGNRLTAHCAIVQWTCSTCFSSTILCCRPATVTATGSVPCMGMSSCYILCPISETYLLPIWASL